MWVFKSDKLDGWWSSRSREEYRSARKGQWQMTNKPHTPPPATEKQPHTWERAGWDSSGWGATDCGAIDIASIPTETTPPIDSNQKEI